MTEPRALRLTAEGRLDDPALLGRAPLRRLLGVLNANGEDARVVGGAVRNALLGQPVADLDIATTAEPPAVIRAVRAAGLRAIPTGLAHGTVTVPVDGTAFEVTTLRRDVETDGRHAVVRFSRDFAEDAERRDFTMNALSVGPDGTVHDTVGGLADLRAGRVRFIGDADRRIVEDYLRILRFFRFHAAYGEGPLDPEGLAAAARHRDGLGRLSRERVRGELMKLLAAARCVPVVDEMAHAGVLPHVLGRAAADPARLARVAETEGDWRLPPDPLLRLAALAVPVPAVVEPLREDLRLSNAEATRLGGAAVVREALDPGAPPDTAGCLGLLFRAGRAAATQGVVLAAADAENTRRAAWLMAYTTVATAEPPQLPIGGAAVMACGVSGGRTVGAVLKRLQADWIRAGFPRDPGTLAALLQNAVAAERGEAPEGNDVASID